MYILSCFFRIDENDLRNKGHSARPSCSKITKWMSLVNVSLKLWSLNMTYTLTILLRKMWVIFAKLLPFFQQKYLWLDIVLTRTVNIFTIYKLVKLTMLWTTGPWYLSHLLLYCLICCAVAVFGRSIRYWDNLVSERQLIALPFVR